MRPDALIRLNVRNSLLTCMCRNSLILGAVILLASFFLTWLSAIVFSLVQAKPKQSDVASAAPPAIPFEIPNDWPELSFKTTLHAMGTTTRIYQGAPFWGSYDILVSITNHRFGWPWRSFETWSATDDRPTSTSDTTVNIPVITRGISLHTNRRSNKILLPIRPVWLGLIASTMAWSTMILCLVIIAVISRRLSRCLRGLCVSCGYCVQGLRVCPECGHVRKQPRPVQLLRR